LTRLPESRENFWLPKLEANRQRDLKVESELQVKGWIILTIWKCELVDINKLKNKVKEFLDA